MHTLIPALHQTLCSMSPESACQLNMYREHEWFLWLQWRKPDPFTAQDLALVINYRRRLIPDKRQFPACLKFGHIVGRPDAFEEDLSMAIVEQKARPSQPDRDRMLMATGRPAQARAKAMKPAKLAAPLVMQAMNRLREAVE